VAANPTLTTSKVYDGTATAAVTAGAMSNKVAGDVVTLSADASYDNKNAGTGKTITVAYAISGTDATNYTKPANYVSNNGEILKMTQTVSWNQELGELQVSSEPILLTATSDKNLAITYQSNNSDLATVEGNILHLLASGSAIITASQEGNDTIAASNNIEKELTILTSIKVSDGVSINIFPNPVSDFLNISTNSSLINSIELKDVQGKIVFIHKDQIGFSNYQIDVTGMAEGVYLLLLKIEDKVLTKKLFIQ
jgi:hypothetical protein